MSEPESGVSRPLSPHLSVYRFHTSMALSILHRVAGVAMTGALVLFIIWLAAAAYNADMFESFSALLKTPVGMVILAAASFVFFFKCAAGIRHLWWDTGHGFAIKSVDRSGIIVILFTLIMTGLTWGFVYAQYCQE
jgi:succinate dehydrogenase / fumarate reductase, cytochrome b subunit